MRQRYKGLLRIPTRDASHRINKIRWRSLTYVQLI